MATKADFTEDEWDALWRGVTGSGMLVSVADQDFTDAFGEAHALSKRIAEERASGATPLLRELASGRKTGFGVVKPERAEAMTLDALRTATATLTAKAPDELEGYRHFVLGVADAVAEAKGGIAPGETAAIAKITEALGAA